ncbi:MAG: sigma-70 family RNA polymerase sigma factor [Clostridium butyricum]|nr:sigma-70 family RNA polymerase sigma factor [Clostridium butyricum]
MQSSSVEKAIEAQFDCLIKKVIKCEQKKYYRDISVRCKKEIPFTDLPERYLSKYSTIDTYSSNYMDFNVLGVKVQILDEQLSEFLEILPEMERNIILLSYFMDMSDSEIGQVMRVVRSTIYRHRKRTLEKIKKMYEEELGNEE